MNFCATPTVHPPRDSPYSRRRRIDTSTTAVESPSATDETDAIAPVRLEAAAALAPLAIVVLNEAGDRVFENNAAAAYTAVTGDAAVVGLRLRNLFAEAVGFDESIEQEIEVFSPASRTVLLQATGFGKHSGRYGKTV